MATRESERPDPLARTAASGAKLDVLDTRASPRLGRPASLLEEDIKSRVFERLFEKRSRPRIGRYDVLELLGQGGMGIVYAAYDHELDRKVALKLLVDGGEAARVRLKREAQAMARLSHANVVAVHEVGEADGQVFIAMEFVRGQNLVEWCAEPRPWQAVVATYAAAARGLIAAHDAGLVHRDLKPHNIMRGEDGSVKVLDFGLARAEVDEAGARRHPDAGGSLLGAALTRTGAIMGTPAYMAPEALDGAAADAKSDQFSFCVSLYEALYRQLPFAGSTFSELYKSVTRGAPRSPPAGTRVPIWLHRALLRGLVARPEERWPSIRALVEALTQDRTRRRRRIIAALGGVALTGAGGLAAAALLATPAARCEDVDAAIAAVWSDAKGDAIRRAFTATGHRLAEDAAARVIPRLDDYAAAWSSMHVAACKEHLEGRQSDRLYDLRSACLGRRRASLEALVAAFEGADPSVVEGAAWATAKLPTIERCGDVEALTAEVPPPEDPAVRAEVQGLRERLGQTAAWIDLGRYEEARAQAEGVRARAEAIAYAPLAAEALLQIGAAQLEAYHPEEARVALTGAAEAAIRSGQDEVAAEALARRMWIVAEPLGLPEVGLADAAPARAFVDRRPHALRLRWLFHNNHGAALLHQGDSEAAERAFLEALAVTEGDPSAHPVERITTDFNLGVLLYGASRPVEGAARLQAARAQAIALLGDDHPRTLDVSLELAMMLRECGQTRAALDLLTEIDAALDPDDNYLRALRSIAVARAQLYLGYPDEARARVDEGLRAIDPGRLGPIEALAHQVRGLASVASGEIDAGVAELAAMVDAAEEGGDATREAVGNARWWLGSGLLRAGRLDEAIAELERASALYAARGGFGPALVGRHDHRLVEALLATGDLEAAEARLAEALAAQDAAGLAEDNLHRATLLDLRGVVRLRRGDPAAARRDHERACTTLAAVHEADDPVLARCRLRWARALGADPRARTLAEQAHDAFAALGPAHHAQRDEAAALRDALP